MPEEFIEQVDAIAKKEMRNRTQQIVLFVSRGIREWQREERERERFEREREGA